MFHKWLKNLERKLFNYFPNLLFNDSNPLNILPIDNPSKIKVQTASTKCWRASQVRWVGKGNRIAICITFSIFTSWGRLLTRKRKTVYTICMEMENFPFQICDVSTCGEVGAQNFHFKWLSVIIFSLQGVSGEKTFSNGRLDFFLRFCWCERQFECFSSLRR